MPISMDESGADGGKTQSAFGALETRVAEIWKELLAVPSVDARDNFFEHGGHSLLAVRLLMKLRSELNSDVSLAEFFSTPTVGALAKLVSHHRLESASFPGSHASSGIALDVASGAPRGRAPLSFPQQQVWLHCQAAGDAPIYNETVTIYRDDPFDVEVLQRCLVEICRRHEIWRTTFEVVEAEPVQFIHPAPERFLIKIADLSRVSAAEFEAEARRLAAEDARLPFDLKAGPLLRALLVRGNDGSQRLHMTLHHIIFDAATAYRVLLPELAALYEAFSKEEASPLPELKFQYGDFSSWQRGRISENGAAEDLAYWHEHLQGELPLLQWPNDRSRPPIETHRGAVERFSLAQELIPQLRSLAQQQGASLYVTLLAGFVALLHRYTGQNDIVLGSLSGARSEPELQNLLGYFVNPLAARFDISGNPTFRELLLRVRQVILNALAHSEAPYLHVVHEVQPVPDPSRSPLFQIIFSQEPQISILPKGWDIAIDEISNGASKLDLFLDIDDRGDKVCGPIHYNPDLFDAATITAMVDHWQTLLAAAAGNPDLRISELPILTAAEQQQLLCDWNETRQDYPLDRCLHELIEAQAQRTPEAVAVEYEDRSLTYAELDAHANRLAHWLRGQGVGPDVLVGLCMERSLDMVVGLLGIMKAGGAYVPIDPSYPGERISFMLADAQVRVLLTQQALRSKLRESGARLLCLDTDWPAIEAQESSPCAAPVKPENLLYTIFTSGSTGRPKGVQIPHRAAVNFLCSMRQEPGMTASDRLLAVTTICFDIAGLELYLPLIVGARVVLASRAAAADPEQLQQLLQNSGASIVQATPVTFRMLLELGWAGDRRLKVLCGGEPMPPEVASGLLSRVASLWNMYGPTETTVWSTVYQVQSAEAMIPIGRPIANTTIYILDGYGQPVPVGVVGELCIGGDGVARGYLNRPEVTAEKFVPDPFAGTEGARYYRTGDLARYRHDGIIECLGRVDQQVKVRGYRIELGEIENALAQHPEVSAAVVSVRHSAGEKELVGYVIARQSLPASELRAHLRRLLPEYMLPAHFVFLDSFPRTPNGKIDRKALPSPVAYGASTEALRPRNETESKVTELWEQTLGVSDAGLRDNFFEHGGHSLLGVRLLARINEELHCDLTLADFFRAPTIEQLVAAILSKRREPARSLVALQPRGVRSTFFCVHSLGSSVQRFNPLARLLGDEQPVYALQPQGLDGGRPHDNIPEMAAHYIGEIRAIQPVGPYFLGGVCLGGNVAFEMAQQLRAANEQVALLALIDSFFPGVPENYPAGFEDGWRSWVDYRLGAMLLLSRREQLRKLASKTVDVAKMLWRSALARRGDGPGSYESLASVLARVREANLEAVRTYIPQSYAGKITLLWATQAVTRSYQDVRLGWSAVAEQGLEVHVVPGNHLSMLEEPHVRVMAATLRGCIDRAAAATAPITAAEETVAFSPPLARSQAAVA